MYLCKTCGRKFNTPQKSYEKHGYTNPPYEKKYICPFCKSTDFHEVVHTHCKCCGALLIKSQSEYCSRSCKTKGEKLWNEQMERFKAEHDSPINIILREIKDFNIRNGTNYSYGQYVALTMLKRRNKNVRR